MVGLFVDLEATRVGDTAGFVFELEDVNAAGQIAELNGGFIGGVWNVFYFSSDKAIDLQIVGLIVFFSEFKNNVGNTRIRVEFNHLVIRVGHRTPYLAICPDGRQ